MFPGRTAHAPAFGANGFAVIGAIVAVLFMSAVATVLMIVVASETLIAGSHRNGIEALSAADAVAEWAIHELDSITDWDRVLSGEIRASFGDGSPDGSRRTADGLAINPGETVNFANCGHPAPCQPSEIVGNSSGDRPWGPDNPVWQLFAHGPLMGLLREASVATPFYVLAMVARDPTNSRADEGADPLDGQNRGLERILLRAAAIGPQHTLRIVQLTIARPRHRAASPEMPADPAPRPLQVVSWHVIR